MIQGLTVDLASGTGRGGKTMRSLFIYHLAESVPYCHALKMGRRMTGGERKVHKYKFFKEIVQNI